MFEKLKNLKLLVASVVFILITLTVSLSNSYIKTEKPITDNTSIEEALDDVIEDDGIRKSSIVSDTEREIMKKYIMGRNSKVFPELADIIIDNIAAMEHKYGLHDGIILAIMTVESNFDIYAISNKNAKGLMQINEAVWKDTLKKEGITYTGEMNSNLYNPNVNIHAGAWIFHHYLEKHGHDYRKALKAYFGGNFESYYHKIMVSFGEYQLYVKAKESKLLKTASLDK